MEKDVTQWELQMRRGIFSNLGYYRSRLQDECPLELGEKEALVDMLNCLEDFMRIAWQPGRVELTRRAADKVRPLEGL